MQITLGEVVTGKGHEVLLEHWSHSLSLLSWEPHKGVSILWKNFHLYTYDLCIFPCVLHGYTIYINGIGLYISACFSPFFPPRIKFFRSVPVNTCTYNPLLLIAAWYSRVHLHPTEPCTLSLWQMPRVPGDPRYHNSSWMNTCASPSWTCLSRSMGYVLCKMRLTQQAWLLLRRKASCPGWPLTGAWKSGFEEGFHHFLL